MCGIVLSYTPREPMPLRVVQAMADALRHRGPDDEGYLLWHPVSGSQLLAGPDTPRAVLDQPTPWRPTGHVADAPGRSAPLLMGHRRLAIVDLSPWGHQPLTREHWSIVFNGELYNHRELREQLQAAGHRFAGGSDTEVLLAVLQHWGAAGLARCNGMWAFAALDAARRRLWIARDRFGVKPLYLWQGAGGALVLASEVKALLRHPLVSAQPDVQRCAQYLQRGPSAWEEQTEFAGITRFPAGHLAQLDLGDPKPLAPKAWWRHPPAATAAEDWPFEACVAAAHVQRYADLLQDAVQLRMQVDVPLGTALSGGLDSSSVAWLVNQALSERARSGPTQLFGPDRACRQQVFSSVYAGAASPVERAADESAFVDAVAGPLGVASHRVRPRAQDVPDELQRMIWALEMPPEGSLMSSWHTYALVASQGVVVTLDGQGADEQLAGYSRYLRNRLAHAPLVGAAQQAMAFSRNTAGMGAALGLGLAAGALRRLAGRQAVHGLAKRLQMGADPSLTATQAMAQDFSTHLQNLLLYADKAGMAFSVESRMPFMDYRLVHFLAGVPLAYKLHAGWTKWLARKAFDGRLPKEVVWRRSKLGWAVPDAAWFGPQGSAAPALQALVLGDFGKASTTASSMALSTASSSALQEAAAQAGWVGSSKAKYGRALSAQALMRMPLNHRMRLMNLALWHQLFFTEAGRPGRALGRAALPAGLNAGSAAGLAAYVAR